MTDNLTVQCRGLSKRYGEHTVVDGVTFDASAGECLALVGHNGAGKTTLMKLMLGLARANSGDVQIFGNNPGEARRHGGIGFLPESVMFEATMSGRETIAFFARLKGIPVREGYALLETVGLEEAARQRVKTYSKGMRQRLGLAQALLGAPQLLLLDEPTTGLDPALRRSFYDIVRARCHDGATVILSSHILTELEARTDRIAIMNHGKLVACDTLDVLRREAGLALNIRLKVKPGTASVVAEKLAGSANLSKVNDQQIHLTCDLGDKLKVLNDITTLGSEIHDVEILPPTFDEVYGYFHNRESQQ